MTTLRLELGLHTIESQLCRLRLGWVRNLLRNEKILEAPRAVFWGTLGWEAAGTQTAFHKLCQKDLVRLLESNEITQAQIWTNDEEQQSKGMRFLQKATTKQLRRVLRQASPLDHAIQKILKNEANENQPGHEAPPQQYRCRECAKPFVTAVARACHQWRAHKITHPVRQLVITNECPGCKAPFATIAEARRHAQNEVCQEIKELAAKIEDRPLRQTIMTDFLQPLVNDSPPPAPIAKAKPKLQPQPKPQPMIQKSIFDFIRGV